MCSDIKGCMGGRHFGFTLVEAILVIAAVGLLIYSAIPMITSLSTASLDAASRKIQADIRWAHQQSVATGGSYGCVFEAGGTYRVFESSPDNLVTNPITGRPWLEDLSQFRGVSIANDYTVIFDGAGRPIVGGDGRVRLVTDEGGVRDVYVISESGLVTIDIIGVGEGCNCEMCY